MLTNDSEKIGEKYHPSYVMDRNVVSILLNQAEYLHVLVKYTFVDGRIVNTHFPGNFNLKGFGKSA